jgi:hypothetical protein
MWQAREGLVAMKSESIAKNRQVGYLVIFV